MRIQGENMINMFYTRTTMNSLYLFKLSPESASAYLE